MSMMLFIISLPRPIPESKLRHPRSVAYTAEQVLLHKQQILAGGARLHCYQTMLRVT